MTVATNTFNTEKRAAEEQSSSVCAVQCICDNPSNPKGRLQSYSSPLELFSNLPIFTEFCLQSLNLEHLKKKKEWLESAKPKGE